MEISRIINEPTAAALAFGCEKTGDGAPLGAVVPRVLKRYFLNFKALFLGCVERFNLARIINEPTASAA